MNGDLSIIPGGLLAHLACFRRGNDSDKLRELRPLGSKQIGAARHKRLPASVAGNLATPEASRFIDAVHMHPCCAAGIGMRHQAASKSMCGVLLHLAPDLCISRYVCRRTPRKTAWRTMRLSESATKGSTTTRTVSRTNRTHQWLRLGASAAYFRFGPFAPPPALPR